RPAELLPGLARVAEQRLDLGGAEITRVDRCDALPRLHRRIRWRPAYHATLLLPAALPVDLRAQLAGGAGDEVAHRVLHAGGDHVILGRVLLQHAPLHLDVVAGV